MGYIIVNRVATGLQVYLVPTLYHVNISHNPSSDRSLTDSTMSNNRTLIPTSHKLWSDIP